MLSSSAMYAAKKRKRPVQKTPKPLPPNGIKSNPSKRHRDRLNGELDKLTSLLPFTDEVRARLDKLSVLRLSVGYLKVKSFFNATLKAYQSSSSWPSERGLMLGGTAQAPSAPTVTSIDGVSFCESDLLLQALNGFVLVVTAEGYVFYTSPTIQDFLGFHQSDVVHQSVFELIHTDDRALFRRQLHFSFNSNPDGCGSPGEQNSAEISSNVMAYDPLTIPPENSSFLERNFCCRFRCLLDNSSGFLALNFHGRLKFLQGQNRVSEDGTPVPQQLALFSIATPLQQPSILEIRTKTLLFQTKHKLDFTPLGIDSRGKVVLGYNEVEICMKGSGYSFIHAADMMHCAENHLRMIKTGDSGLTIFRLLAKSGRWVWVQSNARLVFKGGKPDFIVARQRALTNEEGEEQLRLRRLQLPFNFATGEAVLYDTLPSVEAPDPEQRTHGEDSVSRGSMLGCLLSQDQSLYYEDNGGSALNSLSDVAFQDTHATLSILGDAAPKPGAGAPVKMDDTVRDMMASLQQILGDDELVDALDVAPEELRIWESTLLKVNCNQPESSEDLSDILIADVLSYFEEQLQKDGRFPLPDPLDQLAACLPDVDFQNQNPDRGWAEPGQNQNPDRGWAEPGQNQNPDRGWAEPGQNQNPDRGWAEPGQNQNPDRGWAEPGQNQNQLMLSGGQLMAAPPAVGTVKLSHMDFPQMGSGLNGLPPRQTLPASFQPGGSENPAAPAPFNQAAPAPFNPAAPAPFNQAAPAPFNPAAPAPFNPAAPAPFNPALVDARHPSQNQPRTFQFNAANNNNNLGAFSLQDAAAGHLHGNQKTQRLPHVGVSFQDQSAGQVNPAFSFKGNQWNAAETPNISNQTGFPADFTQNSQLQRPPWPPQQTGAALHQTAGVQMNAGGRAPFAAQQDCMIRMNPANKPSCLYQALPPGPPAPAIPNPDEAALSCQVAAGLTSNGLMVQLQQILSLRKETQINNHPVMGNGGFPFSLLPSGNTCYTENK
ncbi:aryl hydrocarbon receptor 2 [Odontesthes bonariensis]|uniref:aryl hydrocarbon receptor 2 n=1 Tax=Odontesthes bonariensis TaxID=219752 RepID=UPI003F58D11E